MRILIADDEIVSRRVLERILRGWGHEVTAVSDGLHALKVLGNADAPQLGVLDWMMPEMEGPEVCRRVREIGPSVTPYLILLTSKGASGDIVAGLESGADDYVTKPFDLEELRSRIRVGERVLALQHGLADRVRELEEALVRVRQLQGLLPMCAWCKKVRKDDNYWQSVDTYISKNTDARVTHGICPACMARELDSEEARQLMSH
jgi:DNA-binding response OmpR family regulator